MWAVITKCGESSKKAVSILNCQANSLALHLLSQNYFWCVWLQVCALFACLLLRKGKKDVRSLELGVRDGCELSCVCLELYLSLIENKLRPVMAEPSPQPMRLSVPKNSQHSYAYSSLCHNHVKIVSYILSIMINFLLSNNVKMIAGQSLSTF